MKFSCKNCGQRIEYDEGEGNYADGYICYECLEVKNEFNEYIKII